MHAPRSSSLVMVILVLAMAVFVLTRPQVACAEPWTRAYNSGGQVSVDPRTNRTTIIRNGVEVPLWDGVHKLDDGSTITVNAGQVVPNREIIDSRRHPVPPEVIKRRPEDMWTRAPFRVPIFGPSPCEMLVTRVCGTEPASSCAESEACSMSRQILDFENQERAASRMHNRMTRASGECLEAEGDTFFATCAR